LGISFPKLSPIIVGASYTSSSYARVMEENNKLVLAISLVE